MRVLGCQNYERGHASYARACGEILSLGIRAEGCRNCGLFVGFQ